MSPEPAVMMTGLPGCHCDVVVINVRRGILTESYNEISFRLTTWRLLTHVCCFGFSASGVVDTSSWFPRVDFWESHVPYLPKAWRLFTRVCCVHSLTCHCQCQRINSRLTHRTHTRRFGLLVQKIDDLHSQQAIQHFRLFSHSGVKSESKRVNNYACRDRLRKHSSEKWTNSQCRLRPQSIEVRIHYPFCHRPLRQEFDEIEPSDILTNQPGRGEGKKQQQQKKLPQQISNLRLLAV